jgi:predicted TPR repeat methyltransferase
MSPHGINLGNALWTLHRLPEAEAVVRQALALNPDSAPDHANLGRLLADQKQFDAARAAYQRALELQPTLLVAHQGLADLHYRLKEPEQAAAVYAEMLKLYPDDPIARHIIAAYGGAEAPSRACDAYVEKLFDLFADSFDRNLKQLQYRAPELLATVVARVCQPQGQLDVLDAGCGTGLCQPHLRPYARWLTGVDLSEKMLERARKRGGYDELIKVELTAFLTGCLQRFDLIVSADTLVYFGDLMAVIEAAAGALRPGGWLAFTVEQSEEKEGGTDFRLNPHGRYCHTRSYLWDVLERAGFTQCSLTTDVLRLEQGQAVAGWVVLVGK